MKVNKDKVKLDKIKSTKMEKTSFYCNRYTYFIQDSKCT